MCAPLLIWRHVQILVKFKLLRKQEENGLNWILVFSLSDIGLASADYRLYMFTKDDTYIYPSAGSNPISLKEITEWQNTFLIWITLKTDKTTYQIKAAYFNILQYHIVHIISSRAHKLSNILSLPLSICAYIWILCQTCCISHIWKNICKSSQNLPISKFQIFQYYHY